jgi:hypothetical protein
VTDDRIPCLDTTVPRAFTSSAIDNAMLRLRFFIGFIRVHWLYAIDPRRIARWMLLDQFLEFLQLRNVEFTELLEPGQRRVHRLMVDVPAKWLG